MKPLTPGPELLIHSSFDDTTVRQAHLRGDLIRLVAGRYIRADQWARFAGDEQHTMLACAAASALRRGAAVSHASAAASWRLPRLGSWPARVHVTDPTLARTTTNRFTVKHASPLTASDTIQHNGLLVTTPSRTVADIALTSPLRQTVIALDHGLRVGLFGKEDLSGAFSSRPSARGSVRAQTALAFADARADSPGESLSRVIMYESRFACPVLQKEFRSPHGETAFVDFWWPQSGIVGEFDGLTKYRDASLRQGRSAEDIVILEKYREDWIRALPEVRGFVRWGWRDLTTAGRLPQLLRAAGVPLDDDTFREWRRTTAVR